MTHVIAWSSEVSFDVHDFVFKQNHCHAMIGCIKPKNIIIISNLI